MSEELRKFIAPEFVFGWGARHRVAQYAGNLGITRALLVSDPGVAACGYVAEAERALAERGIASQPYLEVTPNPRDVEVMRGVEAYRRHGSDGLVAVGGGSPMDCAKGIGIVAANGGHVLDYEGIDTIPGPCPPLVCVPTTAGSSADVSQFAIVNDTTRRAKIAIVSKALVPDAALIDPETTLTLALELRIQTGLDALAHAIEALVSNAASPITELHAVGAARHLLAALPLVRDAPTDRAVATEMMLGSLLAGLAFSNAILGAVHALAHALGGRYDLPHGLCNALLLPAVIEFNYPAAPGPYALLADLLGLQLGGLPQEQRGPALAEAIAALARRLGVVGRLGDFGIERADLHGLAMLAEADPCLVTNPRPATVEQLAEIYGRIL